MVTSSSTLVGPSHCETSPPRVRTLSSVVPSGDHRGSSRHGPGDPPATMLPPVARSWVTGMGPVKLQSVKINTGPLTLESTAGDARDARSEPFGAVRMSGPGRLAG